MSDDLDNDVKFKKFLQRVKEMHREPKPSLDEIWQMLGSFASKIKYHSIDLLDYEFFQHVGEPIEATEAKDFNIEQVSSWQEAIDTRESISFRETEDKAIETIDQLIEKYDRYRERDAIRDLMNYFIKDALRKKYDDNLAWYIPSDFTLALTEMILFDVGKPTFFRERWTWYDAGHFPCGVRLDGTRIVY